MDAWVLATEMINKVMRAGLMNMAEGVWLKSLVWIIKIVRTLFYS